jgi:hypothetical protein
MLYQSFVEFHQRRIWCPALVFHTSLQFLSNDCLMIQIQRWQQLYDCYFVFTLPILFALIVP